MKKLIIDDVGPNPVKFLRVLRKLTGIGLKESVAIRNSLPGVVLDGVSSTNADIVIKKLSNIGATVRAENSDSRDVLIRFPRKLMVK